MNFCRDCRVIFCNGLGSNENTLPDTASEITISLDLQPRGIICNVISTAFMFTICAGSTIADTTSSTSSKMYLNAEFGVGPLKVEQEESFLDVILDQ